MYNTIDEYLNALAFQESSNRPKVVNSNGYLGLYQMGESALIDAGYYKKPSGKYNNDWSGQFTGKDGVYNKEDFLNNTQAQHNAIKEFSKKNWNYIKDTAKKFDGKYINGIKMTQSGMLAGAHLVGYNELLKYLNSNGKYIPKDGNNVSIEKYINNFGGYNVTPISKTIPAHDTFAIYRGIQGPEYETNYQKLLGRPTGFAADVDYNQLANQLGLQTLNMNVPSQTRQSGIAGYTNPLTGDNRIFTREEVAAMSGDEFARHEKEIMAQTRAFRGQMPTNIDMEREISAGGAVYVRPYTRSDGTQVKGYYRSR